MAIAAIVIVNVNIKIGNPGIHKCVGQWPKRQKIIILRSSVGYAVFHSLKTEAQDFNLFTF